MWKAVAVSVALLLCTLSSHAQSQLSDTDLRASYCAGFAIAVLNDTPTKLFDCSDDAPEWCKAINDGQRQLYEGWSASRQRLQRYLMTRQSSVPGFANQALPAVRAGQSDAALLKKLFSQLTAPCEDDLTCMKQKLDDQRYKGLKQNSDMCLNPNWTPF
ncbi:hypothetical protein [Roseomonas gilardii]|uniref:hypothetical protein n=1 Tax=Roseomonas gilardii TaxID=257708 RepID=UPI0012EC6BF7|nr:hypothetical protein [Roseomonas gilardii]